MQYFYLLSDELFPLDSIRSFNFLAIRFLVVPVIGMTGNPYSTNFVLSSSSVSEFTSTI